MKHFTLSNMPPAHTLRYYMDTSRKRKLIDAWLTAALAWVHCSRASLLYARAVTKLSACVRACENLNRNLQIRAHVLASREGRAWARNLIGDAAIKRWNKIYDEGIKTRFLPAKKKRSEDKPDTGPDTGPDAKPTKRTAPKTYEWKPIALQSLSYRFWKPIDFSLPGLPNPLAKPLYSWPRQKRVLKPATFWPFELDENYEVNSKDIYCDPPPPKTKQVPVPGLDPGPRAETTNTQITTAPALGLDPRSTPGVLPRSAQARAEVANAQTTTSPVPGLAPGSRAPTAKPETNALDPGSSPGTKVGSLKKPP